MPAHSSISTNDVAASTHTKSPSSGTNSSFPLKYYTELLKSAHICHFLCVAIRHFCFQNIHSIDGRLRY